MTRVLEFQRQDPGYWGSKGDHDQDRYCKDFCVWPKGLRYDLARYLSK